MVLGHSNCGAVDATLRALTEQQDHASPNLRMIVDRIRPALEPLLEESPGTALRDAVVANVRQSVEQLRQGSPMLEEMIANGALSIVGAKYSIETGEVRFLDD